jgi:hypothetical protein
MGLAGWVLTAAVKTLTGSWGKGSRDDEPLPLLDALYVFRYGQTQCTDDSCSCLDLQACLQRQLEKAALQQTGLDDLIREEVHVMLPDYFGEIKNIKDCPHIAATQLAVADAFYK